MARPANDNRATEWIELPEGIWRMSIGAPTIKEKVSKWGTYPELVFPLTLTEKEQERLVAQVGEPPEGKQQSYRAWIRGKEATACGYYKGGQYQQTDCGLAQLMCAAVGSGNSRKVREWMAAGGVPPLTPDQTQEAEWAELIAWYSWFENLEVYATIRHDPSTSNPGQVYSHVVAILPVGSLPGQPETTYQQMCAGKVRTMLGLAGVSPKDAASDPEPEPEPVPAATAAAAPEMSDDEKAQLAAQYEAIFGKEGVPA
jgi:hypothetical protein